MTPAQIINQAAQTLTASLWHDLPDNEEKPGQWEFFFRCELTAFAQAHAKNPRRGFRLIRWTRGYARRLYDHHLHQPHHMALHQVSYVNQLSASLMSVIRTSYAESCELKQACNLLFQSWMYNIITENNPAYEDIDAPVGAYAAVPHSIHLN